MAHPVRVTVGRLGPGALLARTERRRAARGAARRWRRRGRRGQVAAVATILGLLLFVTMLANYLSTQLPAQMRLNDANHALVVENQLARFSGLLRSASASEAVGGVISQPISLGSVGAPPFAAADGTLVSAGATGANLSTSFRVASGLSYNPPSVGPAGGSAGSCGTHTSSSLVCSSTTHVVWNFTSASSGSSFSMTTSGGTYQIGVSASGATLAVTASSSAPLKLLVIGNNDTVTVTISGSATAVHITLVGNNDAVNFASSSWTGSLVTVLAVGAHDSVSLGTLSASNSRFVATFFGSNDSVGLGTSSASATSFNVYFNGFRPAKPTATCPNDNLAASTDAVTTSGAQSGSGSYAVVYNDTSAASGTAPSPWVPSYGTPSITCPFYSSSTLAQTTTAGLGASLLLHLQNIYGPPADVAFDQGAVVYAQANGLPLMLVGPAINLTNGSLTIWYPQFVGSLGHLAGVGTAVLTARLVSVLPLSLPGNGYALASGGSVVVTVRTPYAAAWMDYFGAVPSLAGLARCASSSPSVCNGPFAFNGPLGTVTLTVPATSLTLEVATFTVALQ